MCHTVIGSGQQLVCSLCFLRQEFLNPFTKVPPTYFWSDARGLYWILMEALEFFKLSVKRHFIPYLFGLIFVYFMN